MIRHRRLASTICAFHLGLGADGNVAAILSDFGGDPQRAEGLAAFLGFELVSNPEDRLAGALSGGLRALALWP